MFTRWGAPAQAMWRLSKSQYTSVASYHKCPWKRRPHRWGCHSSPACFSGRQTPHGFGWGWTSSSCQTWRSRCRRWSRGPSVGPPGSLMPTDPKSSWTLALGSAARRQTPSSCPLHREKKERVDMVWKGFVMNLGHLCFSVSPSKQDGWCARQAQFNSWSGHVYIWKCSLTDLRLKCFQHAA